MTVRLLAAHGIYPVNAIVTLDAGTEAGLIAASQASADLTGGTTWVAPAPAPYVGADVFAVFDTPAGVAAKKAANTPYAAGSVVVHPSTGAFLGTINGSGVLYPQNGLVERGAPNTVLSAADISGSGNVQILLVTVPGGLMSSGSHVRFHAVFSMTGNDSKNLIMRAGPASGSFATAINFSGQSGLTTQVWAPLNGLIWNNGSLAAQNASPNNTAASETSSTTNAMSTMTIDTSVDWNLYLGVACSIAGSPVNTFTLREYRVEIFG